MKVSLISIAIMAIVIVIQSLAIGYYKNGIQQLESTIQDLEHESIELNQKYEDAHKKAVEALFKSNQEVDTIIAADVPKDCTAAIQWGVTQARRFS